MASILLGNIKGPQGATGNGISSIVSNNDYTLTFVYTDGNSYTTPPMRGADGQRGLPGAGLNILGVYEDLTSLQTAVPSPSTGDAYMIGASAPYSLYIYDTSNWINCGTLPGIRSDLLARYSPNIAFPIDAFGSDWSGTANNAVITKSANRFTFTGTLTGGYRYIALADDALYVSSSNSTSTIPAAGFTLGKNFVAGLAYRMILRVVTAGTTGYNNIAIRKSDGTNIVNVGKLTGAAGSIVTRDFIYDGSDIALTMQVNGSPAGFSFDAIFELISPLELLVSNHVYDNIAPYMARWKPGYIQSNGSFANLTQSTETVNGYEDSDIIPVKNGWLMAISVCKTVDRSRAQLFMFGFYDGTTWVSRTDGLTDSIIVGDTTVDRYFVQVPSGANGVRFSVRKFGSDTKVCVFDVPYLTPSFYPKTFVENNTDYTAWVMEQASTRFGKDWLYNDTAYKRVRSGRWTKSSTVSPVTLLHFSDIHGNGDEVSRILDFNSVHGSEIDDVLCTGDMMKASANSDFTFWSSRGVDKIMVALGNHEYYVNSSNDHSKVDIATVTQRWIGDYYANWNVTRPTDTSWYYKDYSDAGIRLVVLDCNLTNAEGGTAQKTWFESVLADAATNNLAVVVATHYVYLGSSGTYSNLANKFTDANISGTSTSSTYDWSPTLYADSVKDFIDDGGEFVCWLTGHRHVDSMCTPSTDARQLIVSIGAASAERSYPLYLTTGDMERTINTVTQDLFNIVTFDTVNKCVKVSRIGADINMYMSTRDMICYDYANRVFK